MECSRHVLSTTRLRLWLLHDGHGVVQSGQARSTRQPRGPHPQKEQGRRELRHSDRRTSLCKGSGGSNMRQTTKAGRRMSEVETENGAPALAAGSGGPQSIQKQKAARGQRKPAQPADHHVADVLVVGVEEPVLVLRGLRPPLSVQCCVQCFLQVPVVTGTPGNLRVSSCHKKAPSQTVASGQRCTRAGIIPQNRQGTLPGQAEADRQLTPQNRVPQGCRVTDCFGLT